MSSNTRAATLVASILTEALPYIRRFRGKTVVIKYGGSAMVNERLKSSFARDVTLLRLVGVKPVVVHGGGPRIGEWLTRIGKESRFVQGLRATDDETMEVVEMVLGGLINKEIVQLIQRHGGNAVGLTGKDGDLIRAGKLALSAPAGGATPSVDLGRVGRVEAINAQVVETLEERGFIPVVAPIGVGADGGGYNINADWVACEMARALRAEKLILLTNAAGILDRKGALISDLDAAGVEALIADDTIHGGMLPKINAALTAVHGGVAGAHIIDGRVEHAVLMELFTDRGVGSVIHGSPPASPIRPLETP